MIVTAENPQEYNKSIRDFDVVTLDRIKLIHVERIMRSGRLTPMN